MIPLSKKRQLVYFATLLLAIFTYFYALDSLHTPKNGDEYPYTHITRMTAQNGTLLPLQSDLEGMRNTKPPLLFWQGIASTDWAQHWNSWRLRWPSVIYTFLSGALIFMLAKRLGNLQSGFVAVLSFFAFMTTYRYGRPFLTDSPLMFWLFLPGFSLLYWRPQAFDSKLAFPFLAGLALGIGFLYKSFMLIIPTGLTFAWWSWKERNYSFVDFIVKDCWKLFLMMALALGLFSLWFVLDPDPKSILQEFVLKENMGKLGQNNFLANLLWGRHSIWSLAVGLLLNTGLLIFPTTYLIYDALGERKRMDSSERMLWSWVLVYFVVFSLPNVRSARYLLPVMPAIAILLALHWDRIPRWTFKLSLLFSGLFVFGIGYFALQLELFLGETSIYPYYIWIIIGITLGVILLAWLQRDWTKDLTPAALLLSFLCLASFYYPFDHERGNYSQETMSAVKGKEVWVPHNFLAKYERYGFILPGAHIRGYWTNEENTPAKLLATHEYVIIRRAPSERLDMADCQLLGTRIDVRTRHNSKQIREIILENRLDHLFVQEDLMYCPRPEIQE